MDIERAKELLPIIQAFSEGKKIECSVKGEDAWSDTFYPTWIDSRDYRIKPEPKYRPFNDAEECWEEMQKHQPFGWIIGKSNHIRRIIESTGSMFTCNGNNVLIGSAWKSFAYMFEQYTFADGTPCGVKEEE